MSVHRAHDAVSRRDTRHTTRTTRRRRTAPQGGRLLNATTEKRSRRRSIRRAVHSGYIIDNNVNVNVQRTLEAAAYTQSGLLRASSLHIPESVCASCYRGKVRDTYTLRDGRLLMVATDRASAFDRHVGCIPFKGAFLTATSRYWMDIARDTLDFNTAMESSSSLSLSRASADAVSCGGNGDDDALVAEGLVDPNLTVMRRVTPLPFEMVVREYMSRSKTSTSLWHAYQRGERRFCGHDLPEGLGANAQLREAILTPTTKSEKGDVPCSGEDIVSSGCVSKGEWKKIEAMCIALFSLCASSVASSGLILADTKFEIGRCPDTGELLLIDEVLTPDSSRFWMRDSYDERIAAGTDPESLDKETMRRWIAARCPDPYAAETLPRIEPSVMADIAMRYALLQKKATGLEPTTYINLHLVHGDDGNGKAATAVVVPSADVVDNGASTACAYNEAEHGAATRLARNISAYLGVDVQTTRGAASF